MFYIYLHVGDVAVVQMIITKLNFALEFKMQSVERDYVTESYGYVEKNLVFSSGAADDHALRSDALRTRSL